MRVGIDLIEIERIVRVHNISTRRLVISIGNSSLASKGVKITTDPERIRLRPGASAEVVARANTFDGAVGYQDELAALSPQQFRVLVLVAEGLLERAGQLQHLVRTLARRRLDGDDGAHH